MIKEQQPPFYLNPYQEQCQFPDVALALDKPDGLLAVGGNLFSATLLNAYRHGIFPWYGNGQPILWWSPNPRAVLYPNRLILSRSLKKRLRQGRFIVTLDHAFTDVIQACAAPRDRSEPNQPSSQDRLESNQASSQEDDLGTWITPEMQAAYQQLHHLGHAHSVEVWRDGTLIGGLYGIAIGRVFFGESMFSRESDASKVAFAHLVHQLKQWQFSLIDCQISSDHLARLGAENIERATFVDHLEHACSATSLAPSQWKRTLSLHDSD